MEPLPFHALLNVNMGMNYDSTIVSIPPKVYDPHRGIVSRLYQRQVQEMCSRVVQKQLFDLAQPPPVLDDDGAEVENDKKRFRANNRMVAPTVVIVCALKDGVQLEYDPLYFSHLATTYPIDMYSTMKHPTYIGGMLISNHPLPPRQRQIIVEKTGPGRARLPTEKHISAVYGLLLNEP